VDYAIVEKAQAVETMLAEFVEPSP